MIPPSQTYTCPFHQTQNCNDNCIDYISSYPFPFFRNGLTVHYTLYRLLFVHKSCWGDIHALSYLFPPVNFPTTRTLHILPIMVVEDIFSHSLYSMSGRGHHSGIFLPGCIIFFSSLQIRFVV